MTWFASRQQSPAKATFDRFSPVGMWTPTSGRIGSAGGPGAHYQGANREFGLYSGPIPPLAICTIFRNEAAYLQEWIEFHHLVGFERFYLYQNRSDDGWQAVLEPYVRARLVEVTDWPIESPCQLAAYQDFIDRHSGENRWVAFIDCDEFLFSPSCATVGDALAGLVAESWGAIGVNWVCFGSSGQDRQTGGLVIERFTVRPENGFGPNRHIKSLIRMDRVEATGPDPHHFRVNGGTFSEIGEEVVGPLSKQVSHNLLRINHYITKSREEYLQ